MTAGANNVTSAEDLNEKAAAENGAKLEQVLKKSAIDRQFRNRLIANPNEVFDEMGILYPPSYKFLIIELEKDTYPLALPPYEGKD